MQALPALPFATGNVSWPLCEATASQLLWIAAGSDPPAEAARRLSRLLSVDPVLAIWACCRSAHLGLGTPGNLEILAGHLAAQWPLFLVGGQGSPALPWHDHPDAPPDPAATWPDLVGQTLRAAASGTSPDPQDHRELDGPPPGWTHCDAFLSRLMAQLARWLPPTVASTPPPDWLPTDWLPTNWLDSGGTSAAGTPAEELCTQDRGDSGPQRDENWIQRATARWRSESPEPAPPLRVLLPRLIQRTRDEGDFRDRLEEAKLAALKELAYGLGHEINNPLANIASRAQTLLRDEPRADRRRTLATINRQAFRAHEMILDMMLFAKPPRANPTRFDGHQLLREVIDQVREEAEEQGTQIGLADEPDANECWLVADRQQLHEAVQALVINAFQALGQGGHVELRLRRDSDPDGVGWACLQVRDDGPGISEEVRRHLFEPYYSGREAGRGLGLGLSKCWQIAKLHHGQLRVASPVADDGPRGAVFELLLPQPDHASREAS